MHQINNAEFLEYDIGILEFLIIPQFGIQLESNLGLIPNSEFQGIIIHEYSEFRRIPGNYNS